MKFITNLLASFSLRCWFFENLKVTFKIWKMLYNFSDQQDKQTSNNPQNLLLNTDTVMVSENFGSLSAWNNTDIN
ncbi:hypothetical protein BpHYR1_014719 [Brachionus plicatilis]|uniref:Uncharacterized protein n=1 Tax=Brachionus plicatilis TaxID=10195 RepID=A0A3M7RK10_BRAPC|nr:hypothetical protein BpHYR1_014719 [Brachionus plicatilis]